MRLEIAARFPVALRLWLGSGFRPRLQVMHALFLMLLFFFFVLRMTTK
jgi:hypothetical protein